MVEQQKKDAKERILNSAITLFARKGHAAVGVREIAKAADVNISMISYYFDGKIGVLKSIIEEFHDHYFKVVMEVAERNIPPEESMKLLVKNMINFVKSHTELTLAAFDAILLDIPEITESKAERVTKLIEGISGFISRFDLDPKNTIQLSVIGPALISTILIHFRLKSIQKEVFQFEFDENFYEQYSDTIATLFLYGINGLALRNRQMKGANGENNG